MAVCILAAVAACSDSSEGPKEKTQTGEGGTDGSGVDPEGGADASNDGPTEDGDAGDGGGSATKVKKVVFISKATTRGDMTFEGRHPSGTRISADQQCTTEANVSGVQGAFVAWLSTTASPAVSRLADNASWSLVTGGIVFASKAAIAAGPVGFIDRDATGINVPSAGVWTGTEQSGFAAPANCANWASNALANIGKRGVNDVAAFWTAQRDESCAELLHVYCFQK